MGGRASFVDHGWSSRGQSRASLGIGYVLFGDLWFSRTRAWHWTAFWLAKAWVRLQAEGKCSNSIVLHSGIDYFLETCGFQEFGLEFGVCFGVRKWGRASKQNKVIEFD